MLSENKISTLNGSRDVAKRMQTVAEEIGRIARILNNGGNHCDNSIGYSEIARGIYHFRREREKHISGIFGEPAWDILLELFINRCKNSNVTVKAVQISSNVPPTTSLRWIRILEKEGLLEKDRDAFDSRVRLVKLTDHGFSLMKLILSEYKSSEDRKDSNVNGSNYPAKVGSNV